MLDYIEVKINVVKIEMNLLKFYFVFFIENKFGRDGLEVVLFIYFYY